MMMMMMIKMVAVKTGLTAKERSASRMKYGRGLRSSRWKVLSKLPDGQTYLLLPGSNKFNMTMLRGLRFLMTSPSTTLAERLEMEKYTSMMMGRK